MNNGMNGMMAGMNQMNHQMGQGGGQGMLASTPMASPMASTPVASPMGNNMGMATPGPLTLVLADHMGLQQGGQFFMQQLQSEFGAQVRTACAALPTVGGSMLMSEKSAACYGSRQRT